MTGIGREKISELVEARIELECVIVRLAAERATDEESAEIRSKHEQLEEALNQDDEPITSDLEFHLAVARSCHNSVLIRFLMELRQPIWHWMKHKAKYDWGYASVYDQHEAILQAIEKREGKRAEEALKSHLRSAGERLITTMQAEKK